MKAYDEMYCDRCLCSGPCGLVENARTWIRTHSDLIGDRLFEVVAMEYPGAFRPFMIAWADEFGGI